MYLFDCSNGSCAGFDPQEVNRIVIDTSFFFNSTHTCVLQTEIIYILLFYSFIYFSSAPYEAPNPWFSPKFFKDGRFKGSLQVVSYSRKLVLVLHFVKRASMIRVCTMFGAYRRSFPIHRSIFNPNIAFYSFSTYHLTMKVCDMVATTTGFRSRFSFPC